MLLSLFDNAVISKITTLIFTTVTVLTAAAGCTLPSLPGFQSSQSFSYGVLKKDPTNTKTGSNFVKANAVQLKEDLDLTKGSFAADELASQGLTDLEVRKLHQSSKNTLYVLTNKKGLFKSENAGVTWKRRYLININPVETKGQTAEQIATQKNTLIGQNDSFQARDFYVDPGDENNILVTGKNAGKVGKIYRSEDGGKKFTQVYTEVEANVGVEMITRDPVNPNRIYAVLEKGALITSNDNGLSWQKIYTFAELPAQFGFNIATKNVMYVLLPNKGLYTSIDEGKTWENVPLKAGADTTISSFSKIVFITKGDFNSRKNRGEGDIKNVEAALIAGQNLYFTDNITNGFNLVKLPVQSDKSNILDIDYNPGVGLAKVKVSIGNQLIESNDRGNSWSVSNEIPTETPIGNIVQILYDKENAEIIYLGLGNVVKRVNGFGF
jgi:hypothetical protein